MQPDAAVVAQHDVHVRRPRAGRRAELEHGVSAVIFAGMNQYGVPVAELEATTLNTEGQGARPDMDGVHAYGFPWGHAGRSPDARGRRDRVPVPPALLQPARSDNGGFGKFQGGAGSETALVPCHVPYMFWSSIGKNSAITNAMGLFGGYPRAHAPASGSRNTDLFEKMKRGDAGRAARTPSSS